MLPLLPRLARLWSTAFTAALGLVGLARPSTRETIASHERLTILHLLGDRPVPRDPDTGSMSGVVRAALTLARQQVRSGHRVMVATVGHRGWTAEWQGVAVRTLPAGPDLAALPASWRNLLRLHLPFMVLTRRRRFDIVHGHLYNYLRFLPGRARIVHFHGDPLFGGRGPEDPSLNEADFAIVRRCSDLQIGVSRFVSDQIALGLGLDEPPPVVYNGVDLEHFSAERWRADAGELRRTWGADREALVVLYVGAIVPEKGLDVLAEAFVRLHGRHPHLHLAIAGGRNLWTQNLNDNDPHVAYEQRIVDTLAPAVEAGRVHWLGSVGSDRLAATYAGSDLLVVPSTVDEAFGLVALEGLASGLPVVVSDAGGLREFVDARSGTRVPPGDSTALAEALERLIGDGALRRRMAAEARTSARAYDWGTAGERLEGLYRAALAARADARRAS